MLPTYVTPDYSGQGAALKLNSSLPYQYIELTNSPNLLNHSFTFSAWLNPDLPEESFAVLFFQSYRNSRFFGLSFSNRYLRISMYNGTFDLLVPLKNLQWQYVTFRFSPNQLSMTIHIDGIGIDAAVINTTQYSDFEIERTMIGAVYGFYQYNGLIDQLSIAYSVRSEAAILNQATLVVRYTFEDNGSRNESLFYDTSVNAIRATGKYLNRQIGKRHERQGTLRLKHPSLSWFRSSGFVLLVTHNYTYSYTLWLRVQNASSFTPLVHLVANNDMSASETNASVCLLMLVANSTGTSEFS